jgi:hypothetical protein
MASAALKRCMVALLFVITVSSAILAARQSMWLQDSYPRVPHRPPALKPSVTGSAKQRGDRVNFAATVEPAHAPRTPTHPTAQWGTRVTYVPLSPSAYSVTLRHVLAAMQPTVLSETQCAAQLMRARGRWPSLQRWWAWLPFTTRGVVCAALLSTLESTRVIYVDARDEVPRLDRAVSSLGSMSYQAFVGRGIDGVGYDTSVVGFDSGCADGLLGRLDLQASREATDWFSVEATGRSTTYAPLATWMSRVNGSLVLSPDNLEAVMRTTANCTNHFAFAHDVLYDGADTHHEIGFTSEPVVRDYRGGSVDSHFTRRRREILAVENPRVIHKTTYLPMCRKHAKRFNHTSLGVLFLDLPFRVQSVLCGLGDLLDAGGVYMDHDTLLYSPPTLYLGGERLVVGGIPSTGGDRSPKSWRASPLMIMSRAADPCVSAVLQAVVTTVRTAVSGHENKRRSIGASLLHAVDASVIASHFEAYCPKHQCRIVNLAGGIQSRTLLERPASSVTPASYAEQIPRRRILVWKRTTLLPAAQEFEDQWQLNEPSLTTRIVTDDECRDFASRVPGMLEVYDAYPVPVMRADVCRVLAVYFLGGIYMDLDVAYSRPMGEWFNFSHDVAFGFEHTSPPHHRCNWFFGAKARHPCMLGALQYFIELGGNGKVQEEVRSEPHFVHKLTGPAAFGRGLVAANCSAAQYNAGELHFDGIRHVYGSVHWAKDRKSGYTSWVADRDAAFARAGKKAANAAG